MEYRREKVKQVLVARFFKEKVNPVPKEKKRVKQVDKADKLIKGNETRLFKQLEE